MEEKIRVELGLKEFKRARGRGGAGCISEGEAYDTDIGTLFVKRNNKKDAKLMFDGEFEGLRTILATKTLRVPQPMAVVESPRAGAALVMEYLDMKGLGSFSTQMGINLANLHLQNEKLAKQVEKASTRVTQINPDDDAVVCRFGFHVPTCCGYIAMDNTWSKNWPSFYARNRLQLQIDLLQEKRREQELGELWALLQLKMPGFFPETLKIFPALLHGDLWSGNAAQIENEPVAFDPAAFYGHHEYDLAIAGMFGGFDNKFYEAYHNLIPKSPRFEKRHKLYLLFHHLNHWNHFGAGYKGSTLSIMQELVK